VPEAVRKSHLQSAMRKLGARNRVETIPGSPLAPWVVKAQRIGAYDENWPDWYSAYMVAEQSGAELPT
jgi:hypothetical protein